MWPFRRQSTPPPETSEPEAAPKPARPAAPEAPHPRRTADDILRALEAQEAPRAPRGPADPSLGRQLLAEGPITAEFLRQQVAVSGKSDSYLCRVLAGIRAPDEASLFALLAAGYQSPEIDLKQCRVSIPIARSIPREIALKYRTVPLDRIGDLLCVAYAGEPNPKAVEAVRRATGLRVKALRCPAHHLKILLRRLFHEGVSEAVPALPISEREHAEAAFGPEARWESIHATRGPVRAERLAAR